MIRILHCIETIASGGVEQTLLTLIRGLDKSNYHHQIICTWKGGPVAEALESEGVEITTIGSFKHPFEWKKLRRVVAIAKKFKPQIIHGAVFEGITMATAAGLFLRNAVVILEETSDPQNRSKKANLLLKAFSWRADAFQAISSNVGQYLENVSRIKREKIKVIPNGISLPEISLINNKDSLAQQFKFKNELVVGFVGRLFDDHKRVSDLIQAVNLLKSHEFRLLIVGDGPDMANLTQLTKDLDLESQVVFMGYESDPIQFYPMMDLLVIPSAREGFGLVAVEAMLFGLPVIASEVGGLKDVVVDGETGFLVPPRSPESIAEKIQILIDQSELRKQMGEKGRQRALQHFTAERYCRDIENLYLDLLDSKGIIKKRIGE